ncbi:YIP1 family protein [Aquibacillus koreensis]|uniref:YIP1 family protein n=1 Tax=Aquibacillus koreensis TaxID=279446 RepID=A0A9X3WJ82_9BACI|nr:YIP1 family protein [Aquibacillus koreensis]MCT2534824.1 YIP1 family protein [Aquibacillus koreensis]MDC3419565.1 YIP1 family protein [Aquibacillus koreensis]
METVSHKPFRPFIQMWTKPTETMQRIFNGETFKENSMVILLAMLGGISQAFGQAFNQELGNDFSLIGIILLALVTGPIMGIISLYLMGWLIQLTGKCIGGKGERKDIRKAVAWGHVPIVWSLVFILLSIVLFGREYFMTNPSFSSFQSIMFSYTRLIEIIVIIWFIVVLTKCIAVAHKFSAWMALLSQIIAFAIAFVSMIFIAVFVVLPITLLG